MYFDNINLLRGFAAISVLVYHVIEMYPWKSYPIEGPLLWFRIGWLGVDLFFVISGFVITLTASQLYEKYGSSFYKIYFRRRLARIAPLHYLTILIFIFIPVSFNISYFHSIHFFKNLLYHLLFIHNLDPVTHSSLNGTNWTLGVEMQFYILIMISIPYLVRLHPVIILFSCILISWVWKALAFMLVCQNTTCNAGLIFIPSTQVFGCLDEFGFGIFLARIILDKRCNFFQKSGFYRSAWFWAATAILVAWPTFHIYWRWATYWEYWWMIIFWKTLAGATFFSVLATLIEMAPLANLSRWFFKPLWYLGEISYGIYLWHLTVILILAKLKLFSAPEFLVVTLFLTIMLSAASWHFFEKPIIRRFH